MTRRGPEGAVTSALGAVRQLRGVLTNAMRLLFIITIVASIAYAVAHDWDDVVLAIRGLTIGTLLLAFAVVFIGVMAGVEVWHSIVAALGSPLTYRAAAQIVLVGQLGKYVPGSVWAFVAQTELGRRANVPRARAFVGVLVATGVSVVTAFVLAPLALPTVENPWVRMAMTAAPAAVITLHPRLLSWVIRTALRLLRRPQPDLHISGRSIARAVCFSFITYSAFGAHLWLLARSLSSMGMDRVLLCTAAMAMAMTLGVFAFLAPSGLGVREAFIVAALMPVVPVGRALGIALVSRFLFVLADVLAAGAALSAVHVKGPGRAGQTRPHRHRPVVPIDARSSSPNDVIVADDNSSAIPENASER